MSETSIIRQCKPYIDVDCANDLGDCTPVFFNGAGGVYVQPSGSSVGLCDVYASVDGDDDPYEPVEDKLGQTVQITFEGSKKKEFPDVFFSVGWVKFKSAVSGKVRLFIKG